MKIINKITFWVLALTLVACGSGVTITTTKMNDKALDNYETFAYLPNSNFDNIEKFEIDNSVGMSIIQGVNENMKEEGYAVDRSNPDLLLLLTTNTDTEKTISTNPVYATYPSYYANTYSVSPYYRDYYYYNYYDYNRVVGFETDIKKYKEGTLIVSLVDSNTKNLVWRATASDFISKNRSSKATYQFIDDIFEEFPNS